MMLPDGFGRVSPAQSFGNRAYPMTRDLMHSGDDHGNTA